MKIPMEDKEISTIPLPEGLIQRGYYDDDSNACHWEYQCIETGSMYRFAVFECPPGWPGVSGSGAYKYVSLQDYGSYPLKTGNTFLSDEYVCEKLRVNVTDGKYVAIALRYILTRHS